MSKGTEAREHVYVNVNFKRPLAAASVVNSVAGSALFVLRDPLVRSWTRYMGRCKGKRCAMSPRTFEVDGGVRCVGPN
jgi:hypothetical protein